VKLRNKSVFGRSADARGHRLYAHKAGYRIEGARLATFDWRCAKRQRLYAHKVVSTVSVIIGVVSGAFQHYLVGITAIRPIAEYPER
jgi:hypothetical protein